MNKRIPLIGMCLTLLGWVALAGSPTEKEKAMYSKMTANLMVNNMDETLDFYERVLGFKTQMVVPENSQEILTERPANRPLAFALLKADGVEIMCQSRRSMTAEFSSIKDADPYASVTFYIQVADVDRLHEQVKGKATILVELSNKYYGMREFTIRDNNGYILTFGTRIEGEM